MKMKKIQSIAGYTWAVLSFMIILFLFPALQPLSKQVSKFPFMKINPVYSGGEKNFELAGKDYTLTINKPVFEALIGTSDKGFIQMSWVGNFTLPHSDTIDYDRNQKSDFIVLFKSLSEAPQIIPLSDKVLKLENYAKTKPGWIVRVGLTK
jgi:hypothetical protein